MCCLVFYFLRLTNQCTVSSVIAQYLTWNIKKSFGMGGSKTNLGNDRVENLWQSNLIKDLGFVQVAWSEKLRTWNLEITIKILEFRITKHNSKIVDSWSDASAPSSVVCHWNLPRHACLFFLVFSYLWPLNLYLNHPISHMFVKTT